MPRGGGKSAKDNATDAGGATEAATSLAMIYLLQDVGAAAGAATYDVGAAKGSAGADAGLDRPAEGGDDGAPRGDGSASPQSHGG